MKVGDERQFNWLRGIIGVVFILNVIDGVLTLFWVFTEKAEEANPLMAALININPVLFITGKMLLVLLGSLLLWNLRERPVAVISIFMVFLVYYFILLYHLKAMNLRLVERLFG